ncbi:MAG: riboflavin kinase [Enterocloster clostridioformis]
MVHGNHIGGSLLGFPTANILPPPIKRLPRYGVYVSRVLVDGVYYKGVTNIGKKPTVGGEYPAGVETYISAWRRHLRQKHRSPDPAFDRPEQKFTSLEELKERIEKDKEFANAYYEKHPEILVEK